MKPTEQFISMRKVIEELRYETNNWLLHQLTDTEIILIIQFFEKRKLLKGIVYDDE